MSLDEAIKPDEESLLILWEVCKKFVKTQNITGSENVYQSDRVIENAYQFIDDICKIVGFEEYIEEEE